ncbi:MAG TPA: DUF4390 domain-containing protein [Steroidobacteraceae bacterium]|nr:DUF4390 domain-containing protein [Steroidobacteraceae bacterium]
MSNRHRPPRRGTQDLLRRGVMLLACFLATVAATAAVAQTQVNVRSASLSLDQDVYELDARIEVRLPDDARKAIEAGLTLRLDYEIELNRVRNYLPDATVASLVQSYELSYHALSQRYLLRNLNTGEQDDFGTLVAAMDRLCEVRGLPVVDATLVQPGPSYEAAVRAVVDLNTGSEALRWILFWTDDWSAKSEWYEWPLRP